MAPHGVSVRTSLFVASKAIQERSVSRLGDKRYTVIFTERIYRPGTIFLSKLLFMSKASHLSRPFTGLIIGLIAADMLVFGMGNPHSAASWVLIVGYLLLVANFYVLMLGLVKLVSWYGLPVRSHRRRFVRITTGVFGGLIALQSVGQFSGRDLVVVVPLVVLAYLYFSYGSGARGQVQQSPQPASLP
jgi:hypothetical protein